MRDAAGRVGQAILTSDSATAAAQAAEHPAVLADVVTLVSGTAKPAPWVSKKIERETARVAAADAC